MSKLNKIIVAEDAPDIRAFMKLSLEMIGGFDVRFCNSGVTVCQTALDDKPDLIMLDVMMPDMDGPTTLSHILDDEQLKDIPVVFCTAKAMSSEQDRLKELGAIAIITKPFDPKTLPDQLNSIWLEHQQ